MPPIDPRALPYTPGSLKHSRASLVRNWWPVVFWLAIIFTESTDMASARNTDGILSAVMSFVAPRVDHASIDVLNEVLRKTGHFLGYGILSVLVFLALKNTNRDRLRRLVSRPWGIYLRDVWRLEWSFVAVMTTIGMATYDEIHQSFIPSRTGRWQDVILDTCGAIVMQIVVYVLMTRKSKAKVRPQS